MKEFRGRRTRVSYNSEEELVVHVRFLFSLLSFPFSFSCWDKLNFRVRSYTCNNKFNFAVPGPQPHVGCFWLNETQDYSSQQHPDFEDSIGRPCSILTLLAGSLAPLDGGPTRSLISAAIVIKACSTFIAFFADVSKNGMPS